MIQELTKWFYRRNPNLASAMIGWNFLELTRMYVIALIPITLKNVGVTDILLIEGLIVAFLIDFDKNLKQMVVVSLEPQHLRMVIQEEFKKKQQRELEFAQKKVPMFSNIVKFFYWIGIFSSPSFEMTVSLTILCLITFEYFFLINTEADKLLKK